ncbi:MAG: nicotinamide-nucleotide amidohydrolase family protein, partial [candidate division WOR-3 bacterium]
FKDVHVSYLPSELGVDLRLSSSIRQQAMNECRDAIFATLQPYAYATDLTPISQVVGTLLRKRHATVCTAESCTGGLVADWLTDIPGSSDYYLGGVVCYSNHAKHSLLQVSEATLRKHGAVSSEVAQQMAARARSLFAAEYALALTGIAGPAGGTQKKPVGLVYIALAEPGGIAVWELHLNGPRRTIKIQAAMRALDYLRRILLNLPTTS